MRLLPPASPTRSLFGDVVIVAFLMAQALDGVLTYLGLKQFGPAIEANPLISWTLPVLGQAAAVAGAKCLASGFGIVLHVRGIHRPVALLTVLYFGAAIVPWTLLLSR